MSSSEETLLLVQSDLLFLSSSTPSDWSDMILGSRRTSLAIAKH